ncbi:MAG: cupin domain-containing protein [Rhodocyclaceae bacterium]|jgi:mannose-6-phosphate isomerase-like protein (cupin superfamily)|nr:cupin domain-containing protein [Rhodocyclaceae bacterium]
MKPDEFTQGASPFMTRLADVPKVGGLKAKDGWVDMQVQFLINAQNCKSDKLLVGWTVLPPGAQHDRHRHFNCDEFWIVVSGCGVMYLEDGTERESCEGDVVFTPRGHWHGFKNTSDKDVVLVWGWSGAGSLEAAGYESIEGGRTH